MIQLKNCRKTVQLVNKNNLLRKAQPSGLWPVQLRLDLDEYNIYRTMMDKFLNQGGEVRTASVEIDLEEELRYTVCLIGVNGNKFLFSTKNMMGMDELREHLKGSKKFVLVAEQNRPFTKQGTAISQYEPPTWLATAQTRLQTGLSENGETINEVNEFGTDLPLAFWPIDDATVVKNHRHVPQHGNRFGYLNRVIPGLLGRAVHGYNPSSAGRPFADYAIANMRQWQDNPASNRTFGNHRGRALTQVGSSNIHTKQRCTVTESNANNHNLYSNTFLLGDYCFSIPLVGENGLSDVTFKATRLTNVNGIIDEYIEMSDMGMMSMEDKMFLHMDDHKLLSEIAMETDDKELKELLTGTVRQFGDCIYDTPAELDWVALQVQKREPSESYLDMMGVVHMITQPMGTTKEWFAKSNKYHPRGDLQLEFDDDSVTYTVINNGKVADTQKMNIDTSLTRETKDGMDKTTQINYYDFKETVIKSSGSYVGDMPSIEEADLLALEEAVGMDDDGRMIYGVIGNTADMPECYITLNPLAIQASHDEDDSHEEVAVEDIPDSVLENPYYINWRNFAEKYCERRKIGFNPAVRFCFNTYLNSGEVTMEDVDELHRLEQMS